MLTELLNYICKPATYAYDELSSPPSSPTTALHSPSPSKSTSTRNGKRKRKPASALSIMYRKRIKTTIIDDRVAITFLRELGLTRKFFNNGKVLAWALQPDDPDFIRIHDYVERGQNGYGIKIVSILKIITRAHSLAEGDDTTVDFNDGNDDPSATGQYRMMLWHGTKKFFVQSILENGLKLPELYGGMFGKGIYFADRTCQSFRFSYPGHYIFLCDVLLGNMFEAKQGMSDLCAPPKEEVTPWWLKWSGVQQWKSYQSVLGVGGFQPDPKGNVKVNGSVWPLGKTVRVTGDKGGCCSFNEYIVYNTSQVRPRYLIKAEWMKEPYHPKLY